jgi:hypothetical protein
MPSGIQIWDASGNLVFNVDTPVVKFLGLISVGKDYTGETTSGTVTDGRFTAYAGHSSFFTAIGAGMSFDGLDVQVSISGNTLTWTYPQATPAYFGGVLINRPNRTILYGIY